MEKYSLLAKISPAVENLTLNGQDKESGCCIKCGVMTGSLQLKSRPALGGTTLF